MPQPPSHLRIGQLAERTGRSIYAIRWYEAQGLVPGVVRNASGHRVYSEQHVNWLVLMDRLRRTGMSIAEMRGYTRLVQQGRSTLSQRREQLRAHREKVRRSIAEWTAALELLDGKIDFYGQWLETGHRPPELPAMPSRKPRNRKATP
ncbi:MAG: MerR family transcriptional regulator [Aquabacterium sp.]|nr:MAG: MerR family transcriptional regulator [Aquabacterium sp.]